MLNFEIICYAAIDNIGLCTLELLKAFNMLICFNSEGKNYNIAKIYLMNIYLT